MTGIEFVKVDSMYEYHVRVSFVNGTTKEIPAGSQLFSPTTFPPNPPSKISSAANYTAEVSPTSEMMFSEGSDDQSITVVITRAGSRTWCGGIAVHGDYKTQRYLTGRLLLMVALNANDIITTSATVTIPIRINRRQVSNFETYYQTFASTLVITLRIPRRPDERVDLDDPDADLTIEPFHLFEADEEEWVPWVKEDRP
ncbi:hypothetical protein V8E55_006889 [Tylopilus felleus]